MCKLFYRFNYGKAVLAIIEAVFSEWGQAKSCTVKRGEKVEEKKQETMSVREVAEYSGLDEETIQRFVSTNQIPFIPVGGEVRFEKDVIDMWVRLLDCNFHVNITGAGFKKGGGGTP